jgi:hypothetical protein
MQCEWKLKRVNGYQKRINNLSTILKTNKQWTKNSPQIIDQHLTIYVINDYKHLFIESKELAWF